MKFVIGRALTILSWDNPVTAFFRKSRKLRHSLGRPSRSDFVQFEVAELINLPFEEKTVILYKNKKTSIIHQFKYKVKKSINRRGEK